jgi:hypothetical protein
MFDWFVVLAEALENGLSPDLRRSTSKDSEQILITGLAVIIVKVNSNSPNSPLDWFSLSK